MNMYTTICFIVWITTVFAVPTPFMEYAPDIGQTNVGGYGVNNEPHCHMEEKVVFENQCEPYTERTCWTQAKESCTAHPYENCTAVIETHVKRVCFDVDELMCDLEEVIHYQTLEETYQIQSCLTVKDRVCDTIYNIDRTTKDDYQCINVETPNCYMEEQVINDVTCTNSVEFNCKRNKGTRNDGYGSKGVVCSRKPTQDCYKVPRKIQVEVCETDVHKYCEKVSNIHPFPVEEQNCHFEPKKVCEIETKTRPKKAKKYSYTKDCSEQRREICDQCETKTIEPVCTSLDRLVCTYEPEESCVDIEKQFCHKVEIVTLEEVCDSKWETTYL